MEKNTHKIALVSFASKGREDYLKMSERLYDSLHHWKYDYFMYVMDSDRDEYNGVKLTKINSIPQPKSWICNPHQITPYQFKFGMIAELRDRGYDKIFWCDSSISLEKCPLHLLEQSNKGVMAFHNLGHETKDYISPECKEIIGWSEYDENAPQTWGGCIAFDFTKETASEIFNSIVYYSQNGAFNHSPSFPNHRHDQAVMSVLFYRYGVVLYNYGHIVCYNPHGKEPFEFGKYHTFVYGKNN